MNPNNYNIWFLLGVAYYNSEKYIEANKSFLKATELNPNDYIIWGSLGGVYIIEIDNIKKPNILFESYRIKS